MCPIGRLRALVSLGCPIITRWSYVCWMSGLKAFHWPLWGSVKLHRSTEGMLLYNEMVCSIHCEAGFCVQPLKCRGHQLWPAMVVR